MISINENGHAKSINIDFKIEKYELSESKPSQYSLTEDRFANFRENKHPNVYID